MLEPSSRLVALYDASVLYPSLIRNLLMVLGTETLVAARWTDTIHEEWTRNLRLAQPDLTLERLDHIRGLMEKALPDATVSGFESLIPTLTLPDPDDRHVLAAAVYAGADLIVTQNLKHFPVLALEPHGVQALTPDALLCRLLDFEPSATRLALEKLRLSFRNPPFDRARLLNRLAEVGLGDSAQRLQED